MEEFIEKEDRTRSVLKEAKARYGAADEYWAEHQRETTDMLKFVSGDQWDNHARESFENNGFEAITDPVLDSFLRQITNEMRQNIPVIEFYPMDDESEAAAEIRNDLVRNVQLESKADTAYDIAGWTAAVSGLGFFRLGNEYVDEKSFDQKIIISEISDANSVLMDPSHRATTGADMDFCFIRTAMSKEAYKRKYPQSALTSLDSDPKGWTENLGMFLSKDEVIVCEYYRKVELPTMLYQTLNRNSGAIENTFVYPDQAGLEDGTMVILNQRQSTKITIEHFILNEVEILAETTWPGKYIPVIAVKGNEVWIEKKRKLSGAIKPAIDSQVQLNYALSLQMQLVQMAPKAPYIGTAKQFQTYEQQWADVNVSNQAFLPYNKDEGAPPPARDMGEVPIQAVSAIIAQARDNLKQIFNIYDASLGAQSNEESGVAILARQSQSEQGNFHFKDNLKRALEHAGTVMLEAIPAFYDSERTVQTVKPDGTRTSVPVNGLGQVALTEGTFTVSVNAGKSYGTKRQESVSLMMEMGRIYPQAMPLIADLIAGNEDYPGAKDVAARLRTAVPPQALQATTNDKQDAKVLVPQLKLQVTQMTQQLQALNQHAQVIEQELQVTKQTIAFEKQDKAAELLKAHQTYDIDQKRLALDKEQTVLEYELDIAKLKLEQRKIAIQEQQLIIDATVAQQQFAGDAHDRAIAHVDKVAGLGEPITGVGDGHLGGDLSTTNGF